MASLRRGDVFDRGQDFVVTKPFIFNGKSYAPGDVFDQRMKIEKGKEDILPITVRRLRQMYDARMIDIAEPTPPAQPFAAADDDALGQLSNEDLTTRLKDIGVVPRPNASRDWLLRKVREQVGER